MGIFDYLFGSDKRRYAELIEASKQRTRKEINEFDLQATDLLLKNLGAELRALENKLREEKDRGDALLTALDKARRDRSELKLELSKSKSALEISERQRIGLQEMKNISDEEAGQLFGASNNMEDFGKQSRVLWRAGKQAFRDHQMAVSEVFDAMAKHAQTKKPLTADDINFYREYASDAIGRKI